MGGYKYDRRAIAHIVIEAESPLVISSGRKNELTDSAILKDINGLPYIPGSSIAGILRHAIGEEKARLFFGDKDATNAITDENVTDGKTGACSQATKGSEIIFSEGKLVGPDGKAIDGIIDTDTLNDDIKKFLDKFQTLPRRNHVRITHKGAADNEGHGKFDEEVIYKGTRFAFDIEFLISSAEDKSNYLHEVLSELSRETFRIGGGSRSGFGKVKVVSIHQKEFNLRDEQDLRAYLEWQSRITEHNNWIEVESPICKFDADKTAQWIRYDLSLSPVDFFSFGAGIGDDDADSIPVRESFIKWDDDSCQHQGCSTGRFIEDSILIPAASLKGALAHRTAFYSNLMQGNFIKATKGTSDRNNETESADYAGGGDKTEDGFDAVWLLFGYQDKAQQAETNTNDTDAILKQTQKVQQKRGACLFTDIIETNNASDKDSGQDCKVMNHICIDKFTGGRINGALFSEKVIDGKERHLTFHTTIMVRKPDEDSAEYRDFHKALLCFENAIDDINRGTLPLGGGSGRGHGVFRCTRTKTEL